MHRLAFKLVAAVLAFALGVSVTAFAGRSITPNQSNKTDLDQTSFIGACRAAEVRSFNEERLSARGRDAYHTLLVAERFEDKAIGYGGEPSKLVDAYKVLLKEPAANEAFKSLLTTATLAGQLYALCGLYFTDNSFFNSSIERFRHSKEQVGTQVGCIGGAAAVSGLVEAANPIVIDTSRPTESLNRYFELNTKMYEEWNKRLKKKKNERPPLGYDLDILHGGYSAWFAN